METFLSTLTTLCYYWHIHRKREMKWKMCFIFEAKLRLFKSRFKLNTKTHTEKQISFGITQWFPNFFILIRIYKTGWRKNIFCHNFIEAHYLVNSIYFPPTMLASLENAGAVHGNSDTVDLLGSVWAHDDVALLWWSWEFK